MPVGAEEVCTAGEWWTQRTRCEKEAERDHRWKISAGFMPVGPGTVLRPDLDASFRADGNIRNWRRNYYHEYIIPNTVDLYSPLSRFDFFLRSDVLCCRNDEVIFQAHGDFRGQVGDTYRLWGLQRLESFEERGVGFGALLEYRVVGNLWGAFSFQMSPEWVTNVFETGEFVRIRSIDRFHAHERYNFARPEPYWEIQASRHRTEREIEHKQRVYQFAFLFKYDLTRNNRHWSLMPQLGADLLLLRQHEWTVESLYDWRIFSGEYHPSSWAQNPKLIDQRALGEEIIWHEQLRPVAGLTIELWPGHKFDGFGIVADGRHYFNPASLTVDYDSFPAPYQMEMATRGFTLSLNVIARF
jgi:hypothetical protein